MNKYTTTHFFHNASFDKFSRHATTIIILKKRSRRTFRCALLFLSLFTLFHFLRTFLERFCFLSCVRRKRGRKREGRSFFFPSKPPPGKPLPWRNPFARISRLFFVRLPSNNALTPQYYFSPLPHSFRARAEAERR